VGQTSNCLVDSVCRRLRCDLGPETSHQHRAMQGELAIPEQEYGHPHATNNDACIRNVPGPTNSLQLRPCSGALTGAPRISTAQTAGTGWGICSRTRLHTRHRHVAPVRAQRGTPAHARAQHNEARPHLQPCGRGADGPGAGDDGPPAAGEGGTCCLRTVEGEPWVPVGSTVGPRFLAGIRGPQKEKKKIRR